MSQTIRTLLCPGQGAQHVGMGQQWAATSPIAQHTFEQADDILGIPLSQYCFDGPVETLNRTDIAQAALYVTSIASYRALVEARQIETAQLCAIGGLSLGEYTALYLADVFRFEDGLRLVQQRGQFMQAAAEAADSSMVALMGVTPTEAEDLCEAVRSDDTLVPANFNCPGQVVISGHRTACDRAVEEAKARKIRATALKVAGAFHSPIMQPAALQMADALEEVTFAPPRVTVMSNVTGESHGSDTEQIKQLLVKQITHPVRWEQNLQWLLASESGDFAELAPNKVLTGLMRRTDRATTVRNFAEPPRPPANETD